MRKKTFFPFFFKKKNSVANHHKTVGCVFSFLKKCGSTVSPLVESVWPLYCFVQFVCLAAIVGMRCVYMYECVRVCK